MPKYDDDVPELTEEFFARAKPAKDVLPPAILEQFKRGRGRPKAESVKVPVSLRLDRDVVEAFKQDGPGWQTRINDALKAAVPH